MTKISFPTDYNDRTCYVVAINASLIPLVAGALRFFEKRGTWDSDLDYEQGYAAFAQIQGCMMKCCIDDLIASNDRLYRLMSGALYGTEYSVVSTDPFLVIEPPIGDYHSLYIENEESILGKMENVKQLLQNALNGTVTPLYTDIPGIREQLANMIAALEATGTLDDEMLAQLTEIALLVA